MFRRLRAWWDAPLFSMPHRPNERQIPMFTHVDCPHSLNRSGERCCYCGGSVSNDG